MCYKNLIAFCIRLFSKKKFKKYIEKHRLYKTKIKIDRDKFNYINVPKNRNITISIFGSNNKIEIDKELDIRSCINIFICGKPLSKLTERLRLHSTGPVLLAPPRTIRPRHTSPSDPHLPR